MGKKYAHSLQAFCPGSYVLFDFPLFFNSSAQVFKTVRSSAFLYLYASFEVSLYLLGRIHTRDSYLHSVPLSYVRGLEVEEFSTISFLFAKSR